jgi:hypothetical protein
MSIDTASAHAAVLKRRICKNCACYLVVGPAGELPRDTVPLAGADVRIACTLNPPTPRDVRMEIGLTKPDGSPWLDAKGKQRTESRIVTMPSFPPTMPDVRCWQWRPVSVLPGEHHWLPVGVPARAGERTLPPSAAD